ncbi:MAG: WcaI family glycosyltransferase [Mycobacteriales bacterium]|nr:WcaI family glycosyltransferase [Mycobacteriales bacterium]
MRGLRILVVGINYAPEHSGIAPYTTQACEHFVAQGAEVFVLAGVPHYPHWSMPGEYSGRLRTDEVRNGVPVRRLRHHVPAKQSALRRIVYEVSFGSHAYTQRLPFRPDVVLAVVPSLFGTAAAALLARRHGARLVVWVQDLMGPATAQSGIAGGASISRVTTLIEGWALRRAAAVGVLNATFRPYVESIGVAPERIHVVPNWSHVERPGADRRVTRARLGWADDQVIALHSGNMGLKQGLENVVAAARLAMDAAPELRFVLMGDGNQRLALEDIGGMLPNLDFLPPADDTEFTDVLAAADVLLINERAATLDMSLPSKLTSYFRAGRPVLAAVPGLGTTADEIRRSGGGVVVAPEDALTLLRGIQDLMADEELLCQLAAAAAAYSEEHLGEQSSLRRLARLVSLSGAGVDQPAGRGLK